MKAREGDLIRTKNNVIFDVKGLVHPPSKVIAFPRFIPSPQCTRQGKDTNYGKIYSLNERFKYLHANMPSLIVFDPVFGETLCEVPKKEIAEHYKPAEKLASLCTSSLLNALETKALKLTTALKQEADIPWSAIGISGSILADLTTEKSDIDPVIYGEENCLKTYKALEKLLKTNTSEFKPYAQDELKTLFDFRSKDTIMSFEEFAQVENQKAFQGKFAGTDYFIRFVKDWNETTEQYGDLCYTNKGYAKIKAYITDASDALFTPCTYEIENSQVLEGPKLKPIKEISSFRGRFCLQAKEGEEIIAQGKIELVLDKKKSREYYRLIIGNKPSDYMALSHA